MWKKLFPDKEFELGLLKLISETGASRQQAEKVLRECNGNLALAKEKLQPKPSSFESGPSTNSPSTDMAKKELPSTSGYTDAPPPYSEAMEGAMSLPTTLPPPYVSQDKEAVLGELKAVFPSDTDERCCTCFDRIQPDKSEGFSGEMVWLGLKVNIHN